MTEFEAFRVNTIAKYTSTAVKLVEKIEKKIKYLEFEDLFKVRNKFVTLYSKGEAFSEVLKANLSPDAKKWLKNENDIINWKIAAINLECINKLFNSKLQLQEYWDLATTPDNEKIFVAFQVNINMDGDDWDELDENTQREIRIIFDAVDNSKYFLHAIDSYFMNEESILFDTDYKNHLIARL